MSTAAEPLKATMPPDKSSVALVRRLCTEWPTLTRPDFHELLTPDCVYLNMPMPAARRIGPDQAFDLIAAFMTDWKVGLHVIHARGDDAVVLTERLERFESLSHSGRVVELHVMGAFELRDGKIAHWRDYFDSREAEALRASGP